jgi:hypothetical protein
MDASQEKIAAIQGLIALAGDGALCALLDRDVEDRLWGDRLAEIGDRREAIASALGSVKAEGPMPAERFLRDAREFIEGAMVDEDPVRRAIARHR